MKKSALIFAGLLTTGFLTLCIFFSYQIFVPNSNPSAYPPSHYIKLDNTKYQLEEFDFRYSEKSYRAFKLNPIVSPKCTTMIIHGYRSDAVRSLKFASAFIERGWQCICSRLTGSRQI